MKRTLLLLLMLLPLLSGFSQPVSIGDILCTDGSTVKPEQFASSGKTAEGIVFFVDGDNQQGWAVSLEFQATNTNWVTSGYYYDMYDIPLLENFEHSREAMYDFDGYNNTDIIRSTHGADWYPAAWCVDFDHGWYLPAAGQMRWMIAYLNEINASLAVVNGALFVYDRPRWFWTSTERTEAHAVVISQTGAVGNYPKWNYIGEYDIGVRAVKTFPLQAQSHHIGEVVTTADGQQGVVFYTSPEDGSNWLVAMNDLPNAYSWGNGNDIMELYNYNESDQFVILHGVHCGYDATSTMREAIGTSSQYASSHVDLANGWHIPSIGQLSKLYAALPFIESVLNANGGSTLSDSYYWASTECSNEKAWSINFGANLYTEGFLMAQNKTLPLPVRPIWSTSCEVNPPLPEPTLPDNILEIGCNDNTPIPFEGGHLLHQTPDNVHAYATPLCGDLDGDGIVDIVVPHYTATDDNYKHWSNQLGIYRGDDLSLQSTISIPEEIYLQYCPFGLVKYPLDNGTLQGAIFVMCNDGKIRSYSRNGQLLNTSDYDPSCEGPLSFADFNNDGFAEVYVGSTIYDAATLKRLCSGPNTGNKGLSYRGSPNSPYPHRSLYAISYAYNVLDDAKLELICGNTIYNVNINSRTDPSLNSITVNMTITPPSGYPQDGQVALADLDLDGEVEVVVTKDLTDDCTVDNAYLYAYRPSNGEILFQYSLLCRSAGSPAICNIDSDPHPEIVFVDYQYDTYAEKMRCMRYTTGSGINTLWGIHHNDPSGMTTMAFFDFNFDEIPEIVYRDAYNLNIMNGSDGTTLYSYPMRSGTAGEHPVIADINGDGHAEVIATGLLDDYYGNNGYGSLNVFGNSNWPDARPVWNQYVYNVTNVNEDLTVPSFCFNNATVFTASDGTIRRPYNNFLEQAYYITPEGGPIGTEGEPQHVDLYASFYESYEWNGTIYTQPGDYTQNFIDIHGCDSIVTLHLTATATDLPDNILESDCNVPLEGFEWGIREDWSSGDNIYCRINPLVGDLDDDGIPEIVCFDMMGNDPSQTAAKTINVYDGRDKYLKAQINVEGLVWAHGNGPYGLVKLPNRKGLIVTACKDSKLYAYDISLANPSIPVWVSNENYNTGYNDFSVSIGFADFNGDGHPEVYMRDKIFNAETGVLLASAQGGSNQADSYSHNSHTNHNKLSCPLAFDICGDTRQELILGNEIYDVVITNPNGTAGNHVTLTKSITPPNGIINDGHVQVADFNLDGHPDIFISNRDTEGSSGTVSFYVWDVFNNQTSLPIQLETQFSGKSVPLIADLDNEGLLEILIDCCHENDRGLRAYRFNPGTNQFGFLWSLPIDEDSYSNTATLFDFNADWISELIYTDNRYMRIYELTAMPPRELSTIDCGEISIMQVPIVADVDNDGSAEIVVTGKAGGYMQANTMLKVYKSSTEPWLAARKVWNQYMYHVTNVNEDLTIPTFCFNTATTFTAYDGFIRRPFNNFLKQAGYYTPDGELYNPNGAVEVDITGSGCRFFIFNGIQYEESGHYEQLIESETGCDTLFNIEVSLGGTITYEWSQQGCREFVWNGITYTEPGVYEQFFVTPDGCDSIVHLHLSFAGQPEAIPEIIGLTEVNVGTDLIVGQYYYHIDSVPMATHYEWTLEGADWVMDTTGTHCSLLITTPGTAILKVRAWNDCGETEQEIVIHAGFFDVDEHQSIHVALYPNPANDKVFVEAEDIQSIKVYNMWGQSLKTIDGVNTSKVEISLQDLATGIYTVEVLTKQGKAVLKLSVVK